MDGWGIAPADYPKEQNAVALASTPFYDKLIEDWPNSTLKCSGSAVGLPDGVMGNSEVGHLNLGGGRVVWQDIMRIDRAIKADGLVSNEALTGAIERVKASGAALHLMGLVSDGAVHSVDRHYIALLRLAKTLGLPPEQVFFHCFLDGRDTPPQSGRGYVADLVKIMQDESLGRIATVSGRFYAMDRDKAWDRNKIAYDALIYGNGVQMKSADEAIATFYEEDPRGDEFVLPRVIVDGSGEPIRRIQDGDEAIFFNFRADRARQFCYALAEDDFLGFERPNRPKIRLTTMTEYKKGFCADVAFGPEILKNTLAEIASEAGLNQLHIAETQKYAHVTYFFNGGREEVFENEERILVPSPKVETFDMQPEMSAPEVTRRLEQEIRSGKHDLIICNFANCDIVGHTGVLEAAIKAVETVDAALARVVPALLEMGGAGLITADHGNAEQIWNYEENCPDTQHSVGNPTPVILVGENYREAKLRGDGKLGDVAPTLWKMMGNTPPAEMDGVSLIVE